METYKPLSFDFCVKLRNRGFYECTEKYYTFNAPTVIDGLLMNRIAPSYNMTEEMLNKIYISAPTSKQAVEWLKEKQKNMNRISLTDDFEYNSVYVMYAPHPKLIGSYEFEINGRTFRRLTKRDCKIFIDSYKDKI